MPALYLLHWLRRVPARVQPVLLVAALLGRRAAPPGTICFSAIAKPRRPGRGPARTDAAAHRCRGGAGLSQRRRRAPLAVPAVPGARGAARSLQGRVQALIVSGGAAHNRHVEAEVMAGLLGQGGIDQGRILWKGSR